MGFTIAEISESEAQQLQVGMHDPDSSPAMVLTELLAAPANMIFSPVEQLRIAHRLTDCWNDFSQRLQEITGTWRQPPRKPLPTALTGKPTPTIDTEELGHKVLIAVVQASASQLLADDNLDIEKLTLDLVDFSKLPPEIVEKLDKAKSEGDVHTFYEILADYVRRYLNDDAD